MDTGRSHWAGYSRRRIATRSGGMMNVDSRPCRVRDSAGSTLWGSKPALIRSAVILSIGRRKPRNVRSGGKPVTSEICRRSVCARRSAPSRPLVGLAWAARPARERRDRPLPSRSPAPSRSRRPRRSSRHCGPEVRVDAAPVFAQVSVTHSVGVVQVAQVGATLPSGCGRAAATTTRSPSPMRMVGGIDGSSWTKPSAAPPGRSNVDGDGEG
jgi:hypothetical protein